MIQDRYNEEDFNGFVEELIHLNYLNVVEEGISRFFLDNGYDKLSSKQKYVFDKAIEKYYVPECKRCACTIPWCEMIEALDNGGYCNYCQHMMEKIDKE